MKRASRKLYGATSYNTENTRVNLELYNRSKIQIHTCGEATNSKNLKSEIWLTYAGPITIWFQTTHLLH